MVEYIGEVPEAQWAKIEPLLPTPPVPLSVPQWRPPALHQPDRAALCHRARQTKGYEYTTLTMVFQVGHRGRKTWWMPSKR